MAQGPSPKQVAGEAAAALVRNGSVLGLGTGTTVSSFLDALARRVRDEGLQVVGVPTSEETARHCEGVGIPLTDLSAHPVLDLAIDGADEVDGDFRLIKGGGGALLREKIVASAAEKVVIIVGEGKRVETLCTGFLLPVEITPFGATVTRREVAATAGCQAYLRTGDDGQPFVTDNGNWILDCGFDGGIEDPEALHAELSQVPGVVEVGIFLDLCDVVLEGREDGSVVTLERDDA